MRWSTKIANYLYKSVILIIIIMLNDCWIMNVYLYSNHYSQWPFLIFIFNVSFKSMMDVVVETRGRAVVVVSKNITGTATQCECDAVRGCL